MRLFRVDGLGQFTEYSEQDFKGEHYESTLESWLLCNPGSILEDGSVLIIGQQISTNLGSFIDLLALDREGNTVVLELKRDRTPRDTLAQALEYASFTEGLDQDQLEQVLRSFTGDDTAVLSDYHRSHFSLSEEEAVAFNKDQRIVIVGQAISPEIRQTATFLRRKGMRVTCVEFSYFKTKSGEKLLSSDIVVGKELARAKTISAGSLPKTDRVSFLESVNDAGRPVFEAILALADSDGLPIRWGSRGFSVNVDLNGTLVALCFGFPPSCVYKQTVYTSFAEIRHKVQNSTDIIASTRPMLEQIGAFVPARTEMKLPINTELSTEQVNLLCEIIRYLAAQVREQGLVESTSPTSA